MHKHFATFPGAIFVLKTYFFEGGACAMALWHYGQCKLAMIMQPWTRQHKLSSFTLHGSIQPFTVLYAFVLDFSYHALFRKENVSKSSGFEN